MSKKNRESRQMVYEQPRPKSRLALVIKICAFAALTTPLLPPLGIDNFTFAKAAVFQTATTIAFAAWLLLAWSDRRYRPDWRNPAVIAVLAYVTVLLATLPASVDPLRSFWSTYIRMVAVVNHLHFAAWFLILVSAFRTDGPLAPADDGKPESRGTWDAWLPLLQWSNGVALAVDVWGLIMWTQQPSGRIISTVGNALYLGAYCVVSVFIALVLRSRARDRWVRFGYAASAVLHGIILLSTASRSSLIAMLAGLAVYGVYLMATKLAGRRRAVFTTGVVAVIAIFLGLFCLLRFGPARPWAEKNLPFFAQRIFLQDFGADRRALWSIALQAAAERPLFGWGMENYGIAFNKYVQPTGRDSVLSEPWYDRAHNQYLDVLVANGSIGLTVHLACWLAAFWLLWLAVRRSKSAADRETGVVIMAGLFALGVQLGSMFDVILTAIFWYFLLALAASSKPAGPRDPEPRHVPEPAVWLICILALTAVICLDWVPFNDMRRTVLSYRLMSSDPAKAADLADRALAGWNYATPDVRQRLSEGIRMVLTSKNTDLITRNEPLARRLLVEMDKQVAERPTDYKNYLMASYMWRTAITLDPSAPKRIEELFRAAIVISPQRPEAYEEMSELAVAFNDLDKALEWSAESEKRCGQPWFLGRMYFRDAIIWALKGDAGKALAMFQKSRDHYDYAVDSRLAMPLARILPPGPNEDALRYIDDAAKRIGGDSDIIKAWVIIHWKTGDKDNAEATLTALDRNYPDLAAQVRAELK